MAAMQPLKNIGIFGIIFVLSILKTEFVCATATTHIWAPSTDTQDYGTGHITADTYIPTSRNGDNSRARTITNSGLTFGILPFRKLTAECGFDYKTGYGNLDNYPVYFNAKLAIPEDTFGKWFPAIALGMYDIGTQKNKTDDNVAYVEAAKTIKLNNFSLGRFSMGYFWGNDEILMDEDGNKEANGILAAWERTMTEISDKLWVCVEYQGSRSAYGALNLGFSWQFTKSTSVLVGYEFYNNRQPADTVTIQVDINF